MVEEKFRGLHAVQEVYIDVQGDYMLFRTVILVFRGVICCSGVLFWCSGVLYAAQEGYMQK